jgi:hypothetical protein
VAPQELETRVGRLEDEPPIALGSVDLTIGDPGRLRRQFEEIFAYIARVESAVSQNVADVTTFLPDLDEQDRRFLSTWSSHELAHAAIFDALRAELGLVSPGQGGAPEASEPAPASARFSFRLFGYMATNRWIHDVFKLIYLSRGAMHEHMTYDCYRHMGARFEALGELALFRTVTEPIRRQEAAHLGYYRLAAAAHRSRLSAGQVRLARQLTLHTYAPVGAGVCGRSSAGRVFAGLAGDDVVAVLDGVEAVADDLLGDGIHPLPHFVHDAMDACMGRPPARWTVRRGSASWR